MQNHTFFIQHEKVVKIIFVTPYVVTIYVRNKPSKWMPPFSLQIL